MTNLQEVINNNLLFTRSDLKANKGLVREIQIKLSNLGFYPGGQWIDGDLGGLNSYTWKGLLYFCSTVGIISLPSGSVGINQDIAKKLVETLQVNFVLDQAKDNSFILSKLKNIQDNTSILFNPGVTVAFLTRTTSNSPVKDHINNYPTYLEHKPDGTSIISYGDSFTLSTGATISFSDYPNLGKVPNIDISGLDFLSSNISHACVCVGSFQDSTSFIKTHWLGKKALEPQQFLSTTKFIGVLNAICQINSQSPTTDVDNCIIESPRFRFNNLVEDMVSYQNKFGSSNAIGALFKRFTKREDLESWIKDQTGNKSIEFCGAYGEDPLITNPNIQDTTTGKPVLKSTSKGKPGDNSISAYDLVRLISMLGWHKYLPETAQLPSAQWTSLESVVRAMGNDTARYVDVAFETLGVVNVISEPVIISKVGWGNSSMTYAAFVKFVDRRITPSKLRTFALALRCPTPASSDDRDDDRDTNLAAAVTEIVRRIITEELA
ncbi:hypothetical protein [Nostoc sp. 'Peltigera membranacea cyanobiont' N6]|uniref:hypothetical protein n=1 Tax=Nostoc sp. 'Peltigera membranacea cyanobiont' N6 TaxID=1261031 RepID=UPI000CF35D82|nr:hypothetical protein [Nostoc sp. 'Peltigera membranacea cyanobiont' N6]AVH68503.1 hypothetical protein NPM_50019 [Nostoc sp. 'Peltigera membranacea cyanobiont' N6]